MTRFLLHGLIVDAPLPIPGLVAAPPGSPADIAIVWTDRQVLDPLPEAWAEVPIQHSNGSARFLELWRREGGDHLVRFRGATISDYALPAGYRCIEIQRNPAVPEETLLGLALGPVLGVLLRLRGALALHAGAVAGAKAAMVTGPSGAGKSTLILALCQAGCTLLADDMAVVQAVDTPPRVEAGHRGMRLWNDSLVQSGGDADAWPFAPYTSKRAVTLETRGEVAPSSVPLAAIFLLGPRRADVSENQLTRYRPADAMIALSAELYPPFLPLDRTSSGTLFVQLSRLVGVVPVYGVMRPDDFDSVPDLCSRILAEIGGLA
jgi:hypothetical protein